MRILLKGSNCDWMLSKDIESCWILSLQSLNVSGNTRKEKACVWQKYAIHRPKTKKSFLMFIVVKVDGFYNSISPSKIKVSVSNFRIYVPESDEGSTTVLTELGTLV